ncbi:MAG: T9SS type A sorting domain-containing protein [Bacteroidales bacterium]|nr:T9SS type A sorting domain-containing protein [Bacteroidales bacterium]
MKTLFSILFVLSFSFMLNCQVHIQWQKCLGGTDGDYAYSIQQTSNGGYIVAGSTSSNNGDVSGNNGGTDIWIVKLDIIGNLLWQKCFGGTNDDYATHIQKTDDGGYIVVGTTNSNNGDVTGNNGSYDIWFVKLDNSGNIQWQKCIGGTNDDYAYFIQQTIDNGYIVAGYTWSNDGDISGNNGNEDMLIVKLDNSGNIIWQKCFGGTEYDRAHYIQQTTDGGYIVTGYTFSNDGDVSGNNGEEDMWVVKLDNLGDLQWQKCLGGTDWDGAFSIKQTADGGYIVAGETCSGDGDVFGYNWGYDVWIVKLDNLGNIQWQKCLGGTYWEHSFSIQITSDGGYIVAGNSESNDGDVSGNHGNVDFWVAILDNLGNIKWQKCLGGSGIDGAYNVQQTIDGGYIVAGTTNSNDGNVSGNNGSYDMWVVKLFEPNITGNMFLDENENQIKDLDEAVVADQMVKLEPGPQFAFTNNDGYYYFYAEPGNYTVSYVPLAHWYSTTDDYVFSIDSAGQLVDSLDIGILSKVNIPDVAVYITGGPTRAGFATHYWLTCKNWGTVNASGTVSFEYDSLLTYVSSSITPSSIIGNTLEFEYENLGPGVQNVIRTDFVVPGVEFLGDTLFSTAFITPIDPDTCLVNNYDTLIQEITGSFDPNDKNVSPAGFGSPGYVLHGDRLTYTIRFQNTGNDTAFTVVIRDTISNNLDFETFTLEAFSHPVSLELDTGNELIFSFQNILLPDSIVNEPESHGFVRYSISPKPNLAEGTMVTNTAYIFFDYNPAIVTNTAVNTYVSEIPVSIPEQKLSQTIVYPNPSRDIVYINLPEFTRKIEVYDINGKKLLQQTPERQVAEIDINSLPNGIYLVKIYSSKGVISSKFVKGEGF